MPPKQSDRLPPHDLDAERGAIGSILLDSERLAEVAAVIRPDHFHSHAHQVLFRHLLVMGKAGEHAAGRRSVDFTLLVGRLTDAGQLAEVGGYYYLAQVLQGAPLSCHAVYYARRVLWMAGRREVIVMAERLLEQAYSGTIPPDSERARRLIDGPATRPVES